jgi:hypothetical protein
MAIAIKICRTSDFPITANGNPIRERRRSNALGALHEPESQLSIGSLKQEFAGIIEQRAHRFVGSNRDMSDVAHAGRANPGGEQEICADERRTQKYQVNTGMEWAKPLV